MAQSGQAPKPAEDGSFLHQASVQGRGIDFLKTSVASTYGTLVIPALTNTTLTIDVALYDPIIPTENRTSENLLTFNQAIVWYYMDFFVDTDNDFNYELGIGASLSVFQKKIIHHFWDEKTPGVGTTHRRVIQFFNNDSTSDHTIYAHVAIKYILSIT